MKRRKQAQFATENITHIKQVQQKKAQTAYTVSEQHESYTNMYTQNKKKKKKKTNEDT